MSSGAAEKPKRCERRRPRVLWGKLTTLIFLHTKAVGGVRLHGLHSTSFAVPIALGPLTQPGGAARASLLSNVATIMTSKTRLSDGWIAGWMD